MYFNKKIISKLNVSISNNNKFIVSGSYDNTIKIWDFKKGNCLKTL